jgi:membrane-bound ClpP family serine protease
MRLPEHEFNSDYYAKAFANIGERKTLAGKMLRGHFEGKNAIDAKRKAGWVESQGSIWTASSFVEMGMRRSEAEIASNEK